MTIRPVPILKVFLLLFLVLLVFTQATDADLFDQEIIPGHTWSALTLDFSQRDTANNLPLSLLFNISGLQPDGFQVRSVRIKKDGSLDFHYRILSVKTAGNDPLCDSLLITIMKDWQIISEGHLVDLSLDLNIDGRDRDDLIFFLSLEDDTISLTNKVCDFNLVFKTWREYPENTSGFTDEEVLENHVSTGSWFEND